MYNLRLNSNLLNFANEMEKAFFNDDCSSKFLPHWRMSNRRPIEKKESENGYTYYIPLPGYKKEDVKASVLKGTILEIVAKKKDREDLVYNMELPDNINLSIIESKLEDGLLELNVPKDDESKVINIDIN
jgi:HSP20 family molecular chaperone IbpA